MKKKPETIKTTNPDAMDWRGGWNKPRKPRPWTLRQLIRRVKALVRREPDWMTVDDIRRLTGR